MCVCIRAWQHRLRASERPIVFKRNSLVSQTTASPTMRAMPRGCALARCYAVLHDAHMLCCTMPTCCCCKMRLPSSTPDLRGLCPTKYTWIHTHTHTHTHMHTHARTRAHTQAKITTSGEATIVATFAKKEDLGTFFKAFANPKALLQTAVGLGCSAPKQVKITVTMSGGLAYSFGDAVQEAASSLSDGDSDQQWQVPPPSPFRCSCAGVPICWGPYVCHTYAMRTCVRGAAATAVPPVFSLPRTHVRADMAYEVHQEAATVSP